MSPGHPGAFERPDRRRPNRPRAGSPRRIARTLTAALALAFSPGRAEEVTVFAAASLSESLIAVATAYEAKGGDKVVLNLGASSALARQIREGAPADVFFSADTAKMDDLVRAGRIVLDTRRDLLSNTLVIVVGTRAGATIAGPADLAGDAVRRVALAETSTVPAGIYAREFFTRAGLWERIAPKVVATANVRGALAAVAAGNADAGIVYKTDAATSAAVRVVHEVPAAEGPRIIYPVALVKDGPAPEAARRFVAHLATAEARAVFYRFGFLPAE